MLAKNYSSKIWNDSNCLWMHYRNRAERPENMYWSTYIRACPLSFRKGRDRGGGGADRAAAPPLFCAPAPTFCAKKKNNSNKKKTWNKFFPSIFRYILCIFFNFKRQAFCGAPVLFAVIVPWGRLAPWSNAMPWQLPWPPLRFVRQRVLYFQLRQSFLSVLSDEMKKITSFFKPNEGE